MENSKGKRKKCNLKGNKTEVVQLKDEKGVEKFPPIQL
jgi:hypothetical protein